MKSPKEQEANLLSFRVIVNSSGIILTEIGGLPEEKLHTIFKGDDLILIRKIIRDAKPKLENMHKFLEDELDVFKNPTT